MPRKIHSALRERRRALIREHRIENLSIAQAIVAVMRQDGVGAETSGRSLLQVDTDAGGRGGHTNNDLAEIKRLQAENTPLMEKVGCSRQHGFS